MRYTLYQRRTDTVVHIIKKMKNASNIAVRKGVTRCFTKKFFVWTRTRR